MAIKMAMHYIIKEVSIGVILETKFNKIDISLDHFPNNVGRSSQGGSGGYVELGIRLLWSSYYT